MNMMPCNRLANKALEHFCTKYVQLTRGIGLPVGSPGGLEWRAAPHADEGGQG
jgi:hypothetical protein